MYKFFVAGLSDENNKNNMTPNKHKNVITSSTTSSNSAGMKLNISTI